MNRECFFCLFWRQVSGDEGRCQRHAPKPRLNPGDLDESGGRLIPLWPTTYADPLAMPCPRCRAGPGERCRNYRGQGCAPHRERAPVELQKATAAPVQRGLFDA